MFNLVKWAFTLGKQIERHRIASILQQARSDLKYGEFGTGNDKDAREQVIAATDRQVSQIIGRIVDPQYTDREMTRYSVLFPREDK